MAIQIASLFASIGADTSGLEKGLSSAESQINNAASGMKSAGGDIALFMIGLNQALEIAGKVADAIKKVYAAAKEGAELDYARDKFDSLAYSIDAVSSALLGDMREATSGIISDAELIGGAGQIMALGLADSHDEVLRLSTVAGELGMNMNQLVLALTNQSTMRFDQLGLSVAGFEEKVESLKKAGMSAEDAFSEAFLRQAEEQIERIGSVAESSVGSFLLMEAGIKNLGDAVKVNLLGTIEPALSGLAGWIADMGTAAQAELAFNSMVDRMKLAKLNTTQFAQEVFKLRGEMGQIDNIQAFTQLLAEQEQMLQVATYGTQEWADANDRVWVSTGGVTDSIVRMHEAALANKTSLSEWRTELARTAETLREDLAAAYDTVAEAEMSWRMGVSGTLKSKLDEEFEAHKLSADKYKASLDLLDQTYGTNYVLQYEMDLAIDDLFQKLLEDPDGFVEAAGAFEEYFMPLSSSVQNAMADVGDLQSQLSALERTYTAKINIVIATYGAGGIGSDNIGDMGGEGNSEWEVTPGTDAMGGYELAGQPYIVGEAGPELFIPDTNGRVYSNASSSSMLGGGNGDLLAALGRLPTASDIALAVRDALLMVGA
ncbi:MAG: hypothetical protein PHT43_04735 [Anaerolineaceae bacterium]|nr:hypothetical protein [Anaerolineaceae bacterium]